MSTANRHTLFLDDTLSGSELELDVPKLAPPRPKTLQRRRMIGQDAHKDVGSTEAQPVSTSRRFPVKHANHSNKVSLIPVLTGSPWSHYERRYRVRYGHSFGVITSRNASCQSFMIRTISGRDVEEQIQNIRQLCHPNLVENIEIYACSDSSYFLISEFMHTSLLHLCRSPIYPTEPQLSSILHQILTGLEFLLGCGLVHEKLSCANLLMNFAGEVKICDVENCRRSGDTTALSTSFSRVMMKLMDKERAETTAVGLTHPDRWSHEAIDLFTTITTTPDIQKLLAHDFLLKKNQEELLWLIPFVLITVNHDRESERR
ncbi:kinase-like domain-containing protein [Xylaria sp. FL0064]|nr:kinase-like domain-containing protein [Xylaria sp. FL0064]